MPNSILLYLILIIMLPLMLVGCTATDPEPPQADTGADTAADTGTGTLQFRANGEDFVRQGFVSKDGWQIQFNHVYITLANVTAYQSDPPFDPTSADTVEAVVQVSLDEPITIDLAEGSPSAEPLLIGEQPAPNGHYNALSWDVVNAATGPANGYALVLDGIAEKDGAILTFLINLDQPFSFVCGEFVGDERKGIVQPSQTAEVEATFHFDHLFGDAEAPMDNELNAGALGFEPLANLAQGVMLDADSTSLADQLAPEDYQKLLGILPSLGHVGEGHCRETRLET